MDRIRIFMTGVGGQGTLTATTLLARTALAAGLDVTSGEIHGMAQRGGVVESTLLIGCKSPKIAPGEADVLLGFEPLETLRALGYLKPGGLVLYSTEELPPLSVATGKAEGVDLDTVAAHVARCTDRAFTLPAKSLGLQAGAVQAGNVALLGAYASMDESPVTPADLEATITATLKPKIADINLRALELGVDALANA